VFKQVTTAQIIQALQELLNTLTNEQAQAASAPVPAPAYEHPELRVGDAQLKTNGSWNIDGSKWSISSGGPGMPAAGTPYKELYGYISPAKTPRIWAKAQQLLDPQTYEIWNGMWLKNPYGIYHADLESLLRDHPETEVNLMLFSYLTQATTTVVQ
jgi:hypothetical protein